MNWRRLKITCLLLVGNFSRSTVRYWGFVGLVTAVKATIGWGPWIVAR